MTTEQFKSDYYLQRVYGQVSETEIYCRLLVKNRENNDEITGLETKINTYDIGQRLDDSRFSFNPITWENYLNQTIIMLFNLLMLRLSISDIYSVDGKESIAAFFNEYPFHAE